MWRTLCKSKIHRATVTDANIHYPGSLTLDATLMRAAGLVPYEQVHVVDVTNGARLVTYCIEAPRDSGTVCINGAAARLVSAGDTVIIIAYAQVSGEELPTFRPRVVLLDQRNRIRDLVREPLSGEFLAPLVLEEEVPASSTEAHQRDAAARRSRAVAETS